MAEWRRLSTLLPLLLVLAGCGGRGGGTPVAGAVTRSLTEGHASTAAVSAASDTSGGRTASRTPVASAIGTRPSITVAGTARRVPPGCQPDEVTRLVTDFLEAFNRGDQDQLTRVFPAQDNGGVGVDPSRLRWYSVTDEGPDGQKRHFVAHSRAPLLAYFRERHQQHEQLQLRELLVRVDLGTMDDVPINFQLARQADDIPPERGFASGKGGIYCPTQTIFLWSMGQGGP